MRQPSGESRATLCELYVQVFPRSAQLLPSDGKGDGRAWEHAMWLVRTADVWPRVRSLIVYALEGDLPNVYRFILQCVARKIAAAEWQDVLALALRSRVETSSPSAVELGDWNAQWDTWKAALVRDDAELCRAIVARYMTVAPAQLDKVVTAICELRKVNPELLTLGKLSAISPLLQRRAEWSTRLQKEIAEAAATGDLRFPDAIFKARSCTPRYRPFFVGRKARWSYED
jgi:hypothetical protein